MDVEPLDEPRVYPRTDNPLNFQCPYCDARSFAYEKKRLSEGGYGWQVLCAFCKKVVYEISRDTFPSDEAIQEELRKFERYGIGFYADALDFDDFEDDDGLGYVAANDLDDGIPF